MKYRDFRKAINYIFTPGGVTNFYGVIGDDGIRREAVEVKFSKTYSDNIEEYTVRINQEVLTYLDKKEEVIMIPTCQHKMTPEDYLEQLKTNIQIAREAGVYDEAEAEEYRLQGAEAMYLIFKKEEEK